MLDKNDLQAIQEMLNPIILKVDNLEKDVSGLKQDFSDLKQDVSGLKRNVELLNQKQLQMQTTLENAVSKCIQVMGEGYQLNAERFDRLDIDAVKNKADIAFYTSKLANEKVDRLIERLNQSA